MRAVRVSVAKSVLRVCTCLLRRAVSRALVLWLIQCGIMTCGLVLGSAALPALADEPPQLPTAPLERALREERAADATRSEPLARALVHLASKSKNDRAASFLELASQLDPSLAAPHLSRARRALGRFDIPEVLDQLLTAARVTRRDARQEAELWRVLVRGAHTWIWAIFATLAALFALRSVPLAHHVLAQRLGSRTAATLLLAAPLVTTFVVSFVLGLLFTAAAAASFMRRRERVSLAALAIVLAAMDFGLRLCAPHAVLLDPRTRTAQLARLAAGARDADVEASWMGSPDLEPEQQLVLGMQARRRGDPAAARARYMECLAQDSTCAAAYANLANLFFQAGEYERAATGYRTAAALAPEDPLPRFDLAQTYIRTMHYGEADTELSAAAERGIDTAAHRRSIWRDDANPVFDMTLTKSELLRFAAREAAADPSLSAACLQGWTSRAWQSVHPAVAPWLLLLVAGLFTFDLRIRAGMILCSGCGTVVCSHCTDLAPAENLCNACLLARPRGGPRFVAPEVPPAPPQRRVSIASGRWIAPFFPGAADLAREATFAATCTIAAAWAILLAATGLLDAARWSAGAWQVGLDGGLLRLALLALFLLWLPGLVRWRDRERRLRALVTRPARMGA